MSYGYYYQPNHPVNHQPYAYYSSQQSLQLPTAAPVVDGYSLRMRSNSQLKQHYIKHQQTQQQPKSVCFRDTSV